MIAVLHDSKNSIIFTCPGHDRLYKFWIFMHKIFINMLTDEWKNFKKSRDELEFQGKKKKRRG